MSNQLVAQPPVLSLRLANGGPQILEMPLDLLLIVEAYRGRVEFPKLPGSCLLEATITQAHAEVRFVFVMPDHSCTQSSGPEHTGP